MAVIHMGIYTGSGKHKQKVAVNMDKKARERMDVLASRLASMESMSMTISSKTIESKVPSELTAYFNSRLDFYRRIARSYFSTKRFSI